MDDLDMIVNYEEWVLKPYMKKHKCTREEAVKATYYKTKEVEV